MDLLRETTALADTLSLGVVKPLDGVTTAAQL